MPVKKDGRGSPVKRSRATSPRLSRQQNEGVAYSCTNATESRVSGSNLLRHTLIATAALAALCGLIIGVGMVADHIPPVVFAYGVLVAFFAACVALACPGRRS